MSVIINYSIDSLSPIDNVNGIQLPFSASSLDDGPGENFIGRLPSSVNLGLAGRAEARIQQLDLNYQNFYIRTVIQANEYVATRQNILESDILPFSIYLQGGSNNKLCVEASVSSTTYGWRNCTTKGLKELNPGQWYTVDLVYNSNLLVVLIDDEVINIRAFPNGMLRQGIGQSLYVGTWTDQMHYHFNGKIAAIQIHNSIPETILNKIEPFRTSPMWFISYKESGLSRIVNLGSSTSNIYNDMPSGCFRQDYQYGAIMYHESMGAAFEIHGEIYNFYKNYGARSSLGFLVSDEGNAGRGGRKSLFSKGGIYWSSSTGSHPVMGNLYLSYENLDAINVIGFPLGQASQVSSGLEQLFQAGRMYYKSGSVSAHEVHGDILRKFLSSGGLQRWGFPITNEVDLKNSANQVIGKVSHFEQCSVFWSSTTGAFEVHGDILKKYLELGGPVSELGFPTSDETRISNISGAGQYNTFQKGGICWYGSYEDMMIVNPFAIFLKRINSMEDEGAGMGENDIFFNISLQEGGRIIYTARYPSSGDYGDHNIIDVNLELPLVISPKLGEDVKINIDVWDRDTTSSDDHLGTYELILNAANGWGMRENHGLYNSGRFSLINNIELSVKPKVNISALSESQRFWSVLNKGADIISYDKYASAFKNIDSEPEWWDILDNIEKIFYHAAVKDLAAGGNCFGMVLEAIYARKSMSQFSLPINRYTPFSFVESEINIKHCYQLGSESIFWFLSQFASGNTHNPKRVFQESQNSFARGDTPLLCVAENADFSGACHCILPIHWDTTKTPWEILILDPNNGGNITTAYIDPERNTFLYHPTGGHRYAGGQWSGGRIYYTPFSVLCHRPRLPVWDALLLLFGGAIILVGSDAKTTSITDLSNLDIDSRSERAINKLQQTGRADGFFTYYRSLDNKHASKNELLFRTAYQRQSIFSSRRNEVFEPSNFKHRITGTGNGKLSYAFKAGISEVEINSNVSIGENTSIEIRDFNKNSGVTTITPDRDKQISIQYNNHIGVGKDKVSVFIDRIPIDAQRDAQFNLKPGFGGVQISSGHSLEVPMRLETFISGQRVVQNFNVPIRNGVTKIDISSALSHRAINVSVADSLFSLSRDYRTLTSR